ncbi:MAG: AvaI/BsoBI family type II restriction endonuclease [Terriglobia bacterium]|jgi:type II restriction enzyme
MPPLLIRSASDLVTSHRAVCEGFLSQALSKTIRATPFVESAVKLHDVLVSVKDAASSADIREIQNELVAAAGFSDKARAHLSQEELRSALKNVLTQIAEKASRDWREEIVYRYLLTRGDSLGGTMRNVTGAIAGRQLADAILTALEEKHITPKVHAEGEKIQSVQWPGRMLLFDKKSELVAKSVDVILLTVSDPRKQSAELLLYAGNYIACGELKGGIDPAGADEHWKTANSALGRIRQKFKGKGPALFFVGAAIEAGMAEEIFSQIQDGRLIYAANLTVLEQVRDLARWIVNL